MPEAVRAAIESVAASRDATALRRHAQAISDQYRAAAPSQAVIASGAAALAYALSRMPATYAAVGAVLDELARLAPDFVPKSLVDVGAGPGTASWAALDRFDEFATIVLRDHNRSFLDLAAEVGAALGHGVEAQLGEIAAAGAPRDLVICAYALTELGDGAMLRAAEALWSETGGALVIVEPGRPREYRRLLAVRARLLQAGARVLGPCPHEAGCPLVGEDWCHFSVRLDRSREHRQMKGGTLGYEDEKYSYLIVARQGIGAPAAARIIKPPRESKFAVTLPLCGAVGLEDRVVASRDRVAFKAAKKLGWGDGV